MKTKLIFIALMAIATIVNAQQNRMVNPSFDDIPNLAVVATTAQYGTSSFVLANMDKWLVVSNATGYSLSIDPAGANSSTNSFKIFNAGKPVTSLTTITQYVYATKAVQGGGDYTFSFWSVSNKGPLTSRLRIVYYAPTDTVLANPITFSKTYFNTGAYNTSSFSQYTLPSVIIPANFLVKLIIEPYILPDDTFNAAQSTTNTNIWFDDFNFANNNINPLVDPLTPYNALPFGIPTSSWSLDFSDEFNGTIVNSTKWNVDESVVSKGSRPMLNITDWYWKSQNISVSSGKLVIASVKQGATTLYCGGINSDNKYENQYGYYEASYKIADPNQGVTTAFWLMGNTVSHVDGTGNDGAEIDVFECPFKTAKSQANVHIDGYGTDHQVNPIQYTTPNLFTGYHKWGLWWTATFMRVYYDGVLVANYTDTKWIPWVPERILLSVGANWALQGSQYFTDKPLGFLTNAYVDYIRVWKENTQQFAPSAPTEIIEIQKNNDLIIKSNGENCNVKLPRVTPEFEVSIFDLNGRSLSKKKVYNSDATDIDIRTLKSGMYIIRAMTGTENFTKHLIKH